MRRISVEWAFDRRKSAGPFFKCRAYHPATGKPEVYMYVDDLLTVTARFFVRSEPDDEAFELEVERALNPSGAEGHGLRYVGREFVEGCLTSLAFWGEGWYEIVKRPANAPENDPRFALMSVPPSSVVPFFSKVFQLVPKAEREDGERIVILNRADLWHITWPRYLGSPSRYRRILKTLARASDAMPAFAVDAMKAGKQTVGFDFNRYRSLVDTVVARETAKWGWPGRWQWDRKTTDFFILARRIRFSVNKLTILEHILSELNALFARQGLNGRLVFQGLPARSALMKMAEELKQGTISPKDAYRVVLTELHV